MRAVGERLTRFSLVEKNQNINVDLTVLQEYRRRVEEHTARSKDLEESVTARDTAKKRCDDLRKRRLDEFMEGFSIISSRLKEMYQVCVFVQPPIPAIYSYYDRCCCLLAIFAERDHVDDYNGWECRAGTSGQLGSVF